MQLAKYNFLRARMCVCEWKTMIAPCDNNEFLTWMKLPINTVNPDPMTSCLMRLMQWRLSDPPAIGNLPGTTTGWYTSLFGCTPLFHASWQSLIYTSRFTLKYIQWAMVIMRINRTKNQLTMWYTRIKVRRSWWKHRLAYLPPTCWSFMIGLQRRLQGSQMLRWPCMRPWLWQRR